jgi:hypothetical protein
MWGEASPTRKKYFIMEKNEMKFLPTKEIILYVKND